MSTTYVLLGLAIQFVINEFIKNLTEKKFSQVITEKNTIFMKMCVYLVFYYQLIFLIV